MFVEQPLASPGPAKYESFSLDANICPLIIVDFSHMIVIERKTKPRGEEKETDLICIELYAFSRQ